LKDIGAASVDASWTGGANCPGVGWVFVVKPELTRACNSSDSRISRDAGAKVGAKVGENRRFVRTRPMGLVSRVATIIVDPKKPVIACNVVDLSAGGACLEVGGQTSIPRQFVLLHGGVKKKCRLVWQTGRRYGVSF
jgi:PilZ domain